MNEITFDTQQAKVLRAMDQRMALDQRPTKFTTTTTTTVTDPARVDAHRNEAARAADAARADAAAARADGNAAAAAAAASKAAVSDADPAAGAGTGGLVTSAFAGLITEAIPGQTYSGTKGMTALPGTTKPKTATVAATTAADAAAAATVAKANLQGMSQAADPTVLPTLPADFNWKVYLLYHPDLASRGINNQVRSPGGTISLCAPRLCSRPKRWSTGCSMGSTRGACTTASLCSCATRHVAGSPTSSTATLPPSRWPRRSAPRWCCPRRSLAAALGTTLACSRSSTRSRGARCRSTA